MQTTKIFFDTEFTGLHQNTTLISIGLVAETGQKFYAEFTDYDKSQVDYWLEENVLRMRKFIKFEFNWPIEIGAVYDDRPENYEMVGSSDEIVEDLLKWVSQFEHVEMWSDCLSYDWVLFNSLFFNALNLPKNIYYIPFDICTLFKIKGIDPDISRELFAELPSTAPILKHNALYDAEIIFECYNKLMKL